MNTTDDNDLIVCACGCGGEFRRFDDHGRPRRFVSGHNSRVLCESHAEILAYLREHGEAKRGEIADALKRFADELDAPLAKLRERGLVTQPRWGYWAALDGPEPAPPPAELVELAAAAALWSRGRLSDDDLRRAASAVDGGAP
jgi:hypothetical protein